MNPKDPHFLYYQRELMFLREMGGLFAARYPKVAKRLDLHHNESTDPHTERLIESFAFLTSYLQKDIDDQYSRVSSALLNVLYPQLYTPTPPMSVAYFSPDPDAGMTEAYHIPKGTEVFVDTDDDDTCRFRTAYATDIHPLEIKDISIKRRDSLAVASDLGDTTFVLAIRLRTHGETLNVLSPSSLRFYLDMPRPQANILYQLLFEKTLPVVITSNQGRYSRKLPSVAPVGFHEREHILPTPPQGHVAYTLLHEYFVFPQKFFFFDVENIPPLPASEELMLFIPLSNEREAKRLDLTKKSLRLGCTPIVNLFSKVSEPIRLDHKRIEYRLIGDQDSEISTEVHSVQDVFIARDTVEDPIKLDPYFSYTHQSLLTENASFWSARRTTSQNIDMPGTDVMISFINLDAQPTFPEADTAYANILCTNRHVASSMPANTKLEEDEGMPLSSIECLHQPTQPLYPPSDGTSQWQLISHLSLNHLSLSSDPKSLDALKELLRLYAHQSTLDYQSEINGLRTLTCTPAVHRMGKDAWRGFMHGTHISLEIDSNLGYESGCFLLTAVLNSFFSLYTHYHSFTQLEVISGQHIIKTWPINHGTHNLL